MDTYTAPNGNKYRLADNAGFKQVYGPDYSYVFNKRNGQFARWGRRVEDDPQYAPCGPELLDLEVSVNGCPNKCAFCYKGNTNEPATNMTLDTFCQIMDRMPASLTQVAFGITGVATNPDFVAMLIACRRRGVVPNFTLSGIDLTAELADQIAPLVGAVAVSLYAHNVLDGARAVLAFAHRGIKQTNVHLMLAEETFDFALDMLRIRAETNMNPDMPHYEKLPRALQRVNAFVFLGVKPKGRAVGNFTPLAQEKFAQLIDYAEQYNIPIGFDSCSAPKYEAAMHIKYANDPDRLKAALQCSESCESGLFSSYINVEGKYFPCSFSEGVESGIDVLAHDSFLDIWHGESVCKWRERILATVIDGCRHCPVYPEINGAPTSQGAEEQ